MSDFDLISVYSQDLGVEDGFLVDVYEHAKEAGFKISVHLACGIQSICEVPEDLEGCQDFTGRLWGVLSMAIATFRVRKAQLYSKGLDTPEIAYELRIMEFHTLFQMPEGMVKERLWLVFYECEGFTIMCNLGNI